MIGRNLRRRHRKAMIDCGGIARVDTGRSSGRMKLVPKEVDGRKAMVWERVVLPICQSIPTDRYVPLKQWLRGNMASESSNWFRGKKASSAPGTRKAERKAR